MSKYSVYRTLDDSFTFRNDVYNENYHSNAGAWQEARIKYFEACRIKEKLIKNNRLRILELGFGLGYNLIPLFLYSREIKNKKLVVTSFESDVEIYSELIKKSKDLYPESLLTEFQFLLENQAYYSETLEVKIIKEDVRKKIEFIQTNSVDAIYHDPFSPYKNTECWTLELFQEYYRILKDDGIISTYSISTPVRSGFYQAGFSVWKGVGDETKSGGTIASKLDLGFEKLSEHEKMKLFTSPERIPFTDPYFNFSKEKIKEIRMEKKKNGDYKSLKRLS